MILQQMLCKSPTEECVHNEMNVLILTSSKDKILGFINYANVYVYLIRLSLIFINTCKVLNII